MKKKEVLDIEIVAAVELLDQAKVANLLKEGADVNAMDPEEETLITIAAKTSLFDHKVGGLSSFLSYIKDQKKLSKVLAIKKCLEDVDYDFSDDKKDTGMLDETIKKIGDYPASERIKMMKLLINNGANITLGGEDRLKRYIMLHWKL
ncbi:MAG: hypothetical protein A3F72_19200 [Bacteroidetes bacterium RIFCSPLOWO2_12_FULL_35_15]|nr:MAG: hypothetical protein A3F72_19200 [Bacteroidetes bacterium RIFCSPLOWO2_12_FULL_35_15]